MQSWAAMARRAPHSGEALGHLVGIDVVRKELLGRSSATLILAMASISASKRPLNRSQAFSVIAHHSESSLGSSSARSSSRPALRTSKTSVGETNLNRSRRQPVVSAR